MCGYVAMLTVKKTSHRDAFYDTIIYTFFFWQLQTFSYVLHSAFRNVLFYESPAECLP